MRAVNVCFKLDFYINAIIFVALILCNRFIFCSFLIHIINFIFLLDFYFEKAMISRKKDVEIATFDCLTIIFVQIFSPIVSFVFSIIFFNFLIIFFSLVIYFSKQSFVFLFRSRTRDASRVLSY